MTPASFRIDGLAPRRMTAGDHARAKANRARGKPPAQSAGERAAIDAFVASNGVRRINQEPAPGSSRRSERACANGQSKGRR